MNRQLRFGIITIQNVPYATLVEQWRRIEGMGFDSVWLADHFVNPRQPGQPWLEAWTLLAALATQTNRIRIGTLITPFPLRNPALLAREALTVDHISNGRLNLGIGSGQPGDPSYKMAGVEDYEPPERVARFREVVEIVDSLLRNEETTYEGRYYKVEGAMMNPRPAQQPRPPLTIAALGPTMLKIAATYADTWNTYAGRGVGPEEVPGAVAERSRLLDEQCAQIGRNPDEINRSLLVFGGTTSAGPFSSVGAFEDLVGTFRKIGMNEFIFYYPPSEWYPGGGNEQEAIFERVVSEVIPAMRKAE